MDNTNDNDDLYFDKNRRRIINTIGRLKNEFGFDVEYIKNPDKLDETKKSKLEVSHNNGVTFYILKEVNNYYIVIITFIKIDDSLDNIDKLGYKIVYKLILDKSENAYKWIKNSDEENNSVNEEIILKDDWYFKNNLIKENYIEFYKFLEKPAFLPKDAAELKKMGVKLGCLPGGCTVMGGKKSKRKRTRTFIRKSMRKSKSKNQKKQKKPKKLNIIKFTKNKEI